MKDNSRNRIGERPMDRSLNDKAYDLLGELLLEQETNKLLEEIEDEKARGDTAEMDAFFAAHDQENLRRLNSYFHRRRIKKLLTKSLPKAIEVAAIFIACISIAGGVALATNETVRVYMMKLITTMSDEYTALKLVEDEEASFDIPADWEGDNYPSYIPSGLAVSSVYSYSDNCSAIYKNIETGQWQLDFAELGAGAETNLDTENATVRALMIRDYPGFLAVKGQQISLYWSDGQNYFILLTQGIDEAVAVEIAESVRRVR